MADDTDNVRSPQPNVKVRTPRPRAQGCMMTASPRLSSGRDSLNANAVGSWVSWDQAADIVGCPVPTIDWHSRTGRIKTRPHYGNRPTIDAASLEEFREWWQAKEKRREERRQERSSGRPRRPRQSASPPAPPGPAEDWVTVADACEALDLTESTVRHHIRRGDLESTRVGRRVWLSARSVREYAQDREGRISEADAAKLVGCSKDVINRAVAAGKISQREVSNRAVPSLDLSSVQAFKAEWDARRARREAAHREAAALQAELGPPQDGEVWLTTKVVAVMFGVSTSWVRDLAREGRLPHYRAPNGRRYFRRDHVEQVAAARAAVR